MKNKVDIFLDQEGKLRVFTVEVPSKPDYGDYAPKMGQFNIAVDDYERVLEMAKSSAIEVMNQEDVKKFILNDEQQYTASDTEKLHLCKDTIYSLTGYQVEIKTYCKTCGVHENFDCDIYKMEECDFVSVQLALITPIQPDRVFLIGGAKEIVFGGKKGPQVEPSTGETQEELWSEVLDYCVQFYSNDIRVVEALVKKFTIQRKQ